MEWILWLGRDGESRCLLISLAPDSHKSFNFSLHSSLFTWANAAILDLQRPSLRKGSKHKEVYFYACSGWKLPSLNVLQMKTNSCMYCAAHCSFSPLCFRRRNSSQVGRISLRLDGESVGKQWCWDFISGNEIKTFLSLLQLKDKERQMIKERFKVRRW